MVSLRGFEEDKGDIIMKYTEEEARRLKGFKELPENGICDIKLKLIVKIESTGGEEGSDEEDNIEFITEEEKKEDDSEDSDKEGLDKAGKKKAAENELESL